MGAHGSCPDTCLSKAQIRRTPYCRRSPCVRTRPSTRPGVPAVTKNTGRPSCSREVGRRPTRPPGNDEAVAAGKPGKPAGEVLRKPGKAPPANEPADPVRDGGNADDVEDEHEGRWPCRWPGARERGGRGPGRVARGGRTARRPGDGLGAGARPRRPAPGRRRRKSGTPERRRRPAAGGAVHEGWSGGNEPAVSREGAATTVKTRGG